MFQFDGEGKIHEVDGKKILEVRDDCSGKTYFFEVVADRSFVCYCCNAEFYRGSIAKMMAVGAKVTGFNSPDELYQIDLSKHDDETTKMLERLYEEAAENLPEGYTIGYDDFDNWLLLRLLDHNPLDD